MKELVLIIRPEKLEIVKEILDGVHCGGMTISSVMGCGTQRGSSNGVNEIKGLKTNINLLPKIRVEAVIDESNLEEIILQIRTGERGTKALYD